ncbi:hypothetical protein [Aequorivita xiaoshiensis]|uniref:Uncharacterized protein n=1 Tax=Aequorivita xiaoshiensis TaxID=2874476 RepID=A0A9X1U4R7_9FLAO|nr:hypothetical protein [Aequorivita xiaoshiensis]MCG2429778.1 hypothetical protein [Aequorivita xiaoshiensis]
MKKKLREQLSTVAKKIIANESTFETTSVKGLVRELYDKLIVLEYLEKQLDGDYGIAPEKEVEQEESLDSKSFREENWFTEPEPVPQPEHKEDLIEPLMEKIKDIVAQMPEESDKIDEMLDELLPKVEEPKIPEESAPDTASSNHIKNELEEFASTYQRMPEFERKQTNLFSNPVEVSEPVEVKDIEEKRQPAPETKVKSLNDVVNKGLNVGLNDRLAFIKHLFDGQIEDYTRVLSQINTLQSYEEAQSFINAQVKPDYNQWENKEVYAERFMNIIEKRFN